jgi:hypothetical protein
VLNMRPFSKQMLPDMPHTHTNVATWGTIWEPSTALWTLQCQIITRTGGGLADLECLNRIV